MSGAAAQCNRCSNLMNKAAIRMTASAAQAAAGCPRGGWFSRPVTVRARGDRNICIVFTASRSRLMPLAVADVYQVLDRRRLYCDQDSRLTASGNDPREYATCGLRPFSFSSCSRAQVRGLRATVFPLCSTRAEIPSTLLPCCRHCRSLIVATFVDSPRVLSTACYSSSSTTLVRIRGIPPLFAFSCAA